MTDTDVEQRYGFDNTSSEGGHQLQHLAEILDPHSISVLSTTGIKPGMRCLDVGPGAGTITRWLAEQVGPDGQVTAIDIAPSLPGGPNIEILAEDIRTSDFDPGSFDLIHARLVLMHIPERVKVLQRLADWLRPGGAIVLSEWDCTYLNLVRYCPGGFDASLHDLFQTTLVGLLTPRGMSTTWATEAHGAMLHSGLTNVTTVVDARTYHGGTGICQLHYSNSHQLNDALLAAGMTEQQLSDLRRMLQDPRLTLSGYLMHTTTGRRAAAN
ncbi:2-polyprenyl-3-methyl-5-hydroxy-6-metoxy-1,4-benzoquinol methylase [Hamadaea flava]|uniref:Class I SAM-dependent methyltransferase n=1 Tax=Hamadaea flava TaxID=1742688 RepID=A0ABV8LJG9_9ACTN|nr:class I SAM-dependent methyltransferase [Hamadaea flava]MCP2323561.1 2-polyprenyl-3-methyl-5-hydroxy-6-metoxy-1,4-benzoquinol methylase [Hamadaea flava]